MSNNKGAIRLLIVDDYELSRNGLLFGLREDHRFEVVGQAENGEEAIDLAQKVRPDLVLMDIALPIMDGVEATQAIKAQFPKIKVIMLTSRQEEEEIFGALAAGADSYCMKDVSTERLIQVIEMVLEGGFWLDPAVAKRVLNTLRPKLPQFTKLGLSRSRYRIELTEREKEVLGLLVKGKNNKDISEHLMISVHTTKAHVSSIMQKLGVNDRTEAALKALQEGLVPKV